MLAEALETWRHLDVSGVGGWDLKQAKTASLKEQEKGLPTARVGRPITSVLRIPNQGIDVRVGLSGGPAEVGVKGLRSKL